jgi:hypothetical protein
MLYEVSNKRTVIDKKGRDKVITDNWVVSNCMLFAEAETAILSMELNSDVVAISRSSISEFINTRTDDEQNIYLASIEVVDDIDPDKKSKKVVALFAMNMNEAFKISDTYVSKAISNETLIGVKKSKFIDLVKYMR